MFTFSRINRNQVDSTSLVIFTSRHTESRLGYCLIWTSKAADVCEINCMLLDSIVSPPVVYGAKTRHGAGWSFPVKAQRRVIIGSHEAPLPGVVLI